MKRFGVIDLGSNSVRVMLAQVEDTGYFKIIDEIKETIRLGEDISKTSSISVEKIEKTLATLKAFKSLCIESGASEIILVATEALRCATNKKILRDKIKRDLALDIRILNFDEEIYYNHLSIKNSLYYNNSLMVDISGNHTHLAWIRNNEIIKKITIPLGCINLSNDYEFTDVITYANSLAATKFVQDTIKNIPWLFETEFESIIGIGGTIRNIAKIQKHTKRYPIGTLHNYSFDDYDLCQIYNLLKCKNLKGRSKVEGLSIDRADVIFGGLILLNKLVELLSIKNIKICGRGLREGIVQEYLNNNYTTAWNDILDYSIEGIIETLNINKKHAEKVYSITKKLFEELKPIHKLGDEYNNIIKTASLLHDCGISIRYYDHHIHSFYIILNSGISGLSHRELLMSALVASMHRNNNYQLPFIKFTSIINRLDIEAVESIGILLRIAEGLDRSLEGAVIDFDVSISDETINLILKSESELILEIGQALRARNKFHEIYNRKLLVSKQNK
ncbi:exopolyphosphatase [Clostridium zeae]|uniref:Exopolyphosphatase n=1 Tax=Clostridium zeae TaxID=2759022 RepID=A0ABQ1E9W8_9CLOT|nr:Ppx/GppA phosphatase family protein [Clostridium zeae]GFZ31561.1 exopolyphosphatase [Clostridium zeae]